MLLFYIIFGDRNPSKTGPGRRRKSSLQPTLPCFGLQYSISKKTRTTVSLSSMQGIFAESSLRKQAWRNPKEGRVGCLHQLKTYSRGKWLISHLPPTFAIIIHIPPSLRPFIWRPRVPVPHVPASHTWCPQVPRLASPSPKSPHTRPDVPVPLFYTAVVIRTYLA